MELMGPLRLLRQQRWVCSLAPRKGFVSSGIHLSTATDSMPFGYSKVWLLVGLSTFVTLEQEISKQQCGVETQMALSSRLFVAFLS